MRALRGRIGLNTGVAALGNLGSTQIMSYTAMGDSVNVASRLEGVNKLYGTVIIIGEASRGAAGAAIAGRSVSATVVSPAAILRRPSRAPG